MSEPPTDFKSTYEEEQLGSGIIRIFRDKPFAMTGVVGMVAACGYGYWRYKTKGFLVSPSVFLLQLRVGAQTMVVGCITVGMLYNMYQKHILDKKSKD